MKKLLAFGVILLFFGVACSPSIVADDYVCQQVNNTVYSQDDKLISLPVREYKPDGTIREYFVELTESQYDEMNRRLQIAGDLDERLSIYKDYKVVPEDVTSESLRAGMEEKARRFGLNKKIDKMVGSRENLPSSMGSTDVYDNYNCLIIVTFMYGIAPALGLSVITGRLNHYIFLLAFAAGSVQNYFLFLLISLLLIPASLIYPIYNKDLLTFCAGRFGSVKATNGDMPDFELGYSDLIPTFNGYVWMTGFVGYSYIGWFGAFRFCDFFGSAHFIRACSDD